MAAKNEVIKLAKCCGTCSTFTRDDLTDDFDTIGDCKRTRSRVSNFETCKYWKYNFDKLKKQGYDDKLNYCVSRILIHEGVEEVEIY